MRERGFSLTALFCLPREICRRRFDALLELLPGRGDLRCGLLHAFANESQLVHPEMRHYDAVAFCERYRRRGQTADLPADPAGECDDGANTERCNHEASQCRG